MQNVYISSVFAGGRPFCTQILAPQGRPQSTNLGTKKLETMGYPTVKISAFLVFDTIPECDRQTNGQTDKRTDGRICRSIGLYSACKASFAERCKRVEFFSET